MPVIQNYTPSDNKLIISVNGIFGFSEHAGFRDTYRYIKPTKNLTIFIISQNTEYMDSSTWGMLLLIDERFLTQKITIINCSDYIKKILEIIQFQLKLTAL